MEGETYLQGVRRRKKEVESEIGKMKEEDKKTQKDNLKSLVKDFMNFRKDKMEEKEVDEFINNKRFKDGETLFSETKRFQRLKEIKTILGKWSKNIDKEGLGFIISIRSRLKKKGMMTNGQYKWFIYKLGGVSTLDNIKLKEKWKCIDESQKTYFKDDLRRIFVRYGLEWNELEGLDSENLNRVSLDKVLSDDDYRERIGKGKLKGF